MGVRGPGKQSKALRRFGWRPPLISPEFSSLVEAIATSRGWSKRQVLEMALMRLATSKEAEAAGLC